MRKMRSFLFNQQNIILIARIFYCFNNRSTDHKGFWIWTFEKLVFSGAWESHRTSDSGSDSTTLIVCAVALLFVCVKPFVNIMLKNSDSTANYPINKSLWRFPWTTRNLSPLFLPLLAPMSQPYRLPLFPLSPFLFLYLCLCLFLSPLLYQY